jgi:DNA (cytosine-5)-methyltransferase 1
MILDLFGGPGGWDWAAEILGLKRVVGVEYDRWACATRAAAGLTTIRADVSQMAVAPLTGKILGLIGSPPCTTFSAAGGRAGVGILEILSAAIRDQFAGRDTRGQRRREMAAALHRAGWIPALPARPFRAARIVAAARSAALVVEPARFIAATRPEWVALEQVPSVLPLWEVYAEELRKLGYSVWTGKLVAADYGVPQTRLRAFLIASRVRTVRRPTPTHYDPRKGAQLFGKPWVSMAAALGWGATDRSAPTVTSGGAATGGAEPFGHRSRDALADELAAGRWALRTNTTTKATLPRPADEPAPTMAFGHRANLVAWVHDRPSTTVVGEARISQPGHSGARGDSQSTDAIRITVREAAVIQSFPADYPWAGTQTKQFEQAGNAVPPRLAAHVLAAAAGLAFLKAAA